MIHPLYFSCRNHIKLLCISLQTLRGVRFPLLGPVNVSFDKHNTPTDEELEKINKAYPDVIIHRTDHQARGGWKMVQTELATYRKIGNDLPPSDWLMKCDCDTFWLHDAILKYVNNNEEVSLIGNTCINKELIAWTQGGCYFVRAGAADKLELDTERLEAQMARTFREWHRKPGECCNEDLCVFLAVLRAKLPVELRYYYNDSLIHFCERKNEMIKLAQATEGVHVY